MNPAGVTGRAGGLDVAKQLVERALGKDATATLDNVRQSIEALPFGFLQKVDSQNLLTFIIDEHPQTIALILSHLPPQQPAEIISGLPADRQLSVIRRMATMGQTSPEIIKEVERGLEHRMSSVMSQQFENAGGVSSVAEMLNVIDRATERSLLENLSQEDPDLVEEIRRLMFVFEDITKLGNREIQTLLKNVDSSQWAMALKGASAELKDKVLNNMSKRASRPAPRRNGVSWPGAAFERRADAAADRRCGPPPGRCWRDHDARRGTGRAVHPIATCLGTVPIFVRRKWDCPLWPPDFLLRLPDHAGKNLQVEVFDQSGFEPLDRDRAHHGVVGAKLQRGHMQLDVAAAASSCSRSRKRALAATPPPTHKMCNPQVRRLQRPFRLAHRPQPPESWPPSRQLPAARARSG